MPCHVMPGKVFWARQVKQNWAGWAGQTGWEDQPDCIKQDIQLLKLVRQITHFEI